DFLFSYYLLAFIALTAADTRVGALASSHGNRPQHSGRSKALISAPVPGPSRRLIRRCRGKKTPARAGVKILCRIGDKCGGRCRMGFGRRVADAGDALSSFAKIRPWIEAAPRPGNNEENHTWICER